MEDQEKQQGSFFRFEELRIYHKSLDYYQWLKSQVKNFNEFDFKTIGKPLLKAAANISINIAEGSTRQKPQFVIFLKDARTALRECVVRATMAYKEVLFDDNQMAYSVEQLEEMTRMLGAMINSLLRNIEKEGHSNNPSEQQPVSSDVNPNFEY